MAEQAKYSWRKPPKWDYFPSGELCVTILTEKWGKHTPIDELSTWADGKVRRVETMVREVIHAMLAEVDRRCVQAAHAREHQRQEMEAAKVRRLEEERRRQERLRVDDLVAEVKRWEMAERIRRFVQAAREAALKQHGTIETGSPLQQSLIWAT